MSYTRKQWENGELLNADKMNHIESGVYDNAVTQTSVSEGVASFKNADGETLFTLPLSWEKLATAEFTVSTTSTTNTNLSPSIPCGARAFDS